MKNMLSTCAVMVLLGAVSAQGQSAVTEYKGLDGNVNQTIDGHGAWLDNSGSWIYTPSSSIEQLWMRNGTDTTLSGMTLGTSGWLKMGESLLPVPPAGTTKLHVIGSNAFVNVSLSSKNQGLRIGQDYSAHLYVEGGTVTVANGTEGKPIHVGIDGRYGNPNAEARLFITGGYVNAKAKVNIGSWGSLNGKIDISGGVLQTPLIQVGNCSNDDYAPGTGTGVLAVSGTGLVQVGGAGIELGTGYGSGTNYNTNGTLEQTGGSVRLTGTSNCDLKIGNWGTGLYSLTGGVLDMMYLSTDIIVGGGVSGRFKVGQGGKVVSQGTYQSFANATLELLIGSSANFDMSFLSIYAATSTFDGDLAMTLTGGYTPTYGQEWKVMSFAGPLTGAFDSVTTDWEYSIRNEGGLKNLYVKYMKSAVSHPGDANGDNLVNVGDLGILAGNWGGSGKTWAEGDFTGDGLVNVSDLGVLSGNWGWAGGSMQPVPEPATLGLLALGAIGLVRRRRS